jgi:hypothetical protein
MLGAMRPWPLVAIITCMALAGCGGSSRSSSSQAAATPAASASASAQTTSSTPPATTGTDDTTTTTSSATAPPEVPKAKKHKHHASSSGHGGVSQGAHVETSVTVGANGDVSPGVVSVPSGVGVELRVTNRGNRAATIVLSVPGHPRAHVAPGAGATLETAGLKDGTYRILVNGTRRGQLMIGAQGGP